MKPALDSFSENIKRVRDLVSTYTILRSQTTSALDLSDILRASLVMALSAFDHFIHEVTRLGILSIHVGTRQEPPGFARFNVSLRKFRSAINAAIDTQWLDAEIRERNGWLTFQDPEKVADALRFISDRPIWNEVGAKLGVDARTAKIQLKLIVDRRNKIAHEADMDPTSPGARWPIDEALAREAIDYIDKLAHAIFEVIDAP